MDALCAVFLFRSTLRSSKRVNCTYTKASIVRSIVPIALRLLYNACLYVNSREIIETQIWAKLIICK